MQNVTGVFDGLSKRSIRRPVVDVKIGWRRIKDENIDFAVVGTSTVGGGDIVQGEFTSITNNDLFEYFIESDNLVSVSTDQELVEPLGGVSYGRSNILLSNTDDRYIAGKDATIGQFITRNRPIKLFMGFTDDNDTNQEIPLLYGLSKDIEYQSANKLVKIPIYDYLSFIDDYGLNSQRFVAKRTDEIIESILTEIGFVPEQYELDTGLNTIGFAWISKDQTAGSIIRRLCQSEGGYFYQTETGKIVFLNRDNAINTDRTLIDKGEMLELEESISNNMYNSVTVKSYPRIVLAEQTIYEADNAIEIPTGTSSFFITLDDPLSSLSSPVATTNWVANSARDGSGTDETADVDVTLTDFVDTIKVNVNNTSGDVAYLTTLLLEGEPTVVEKVIEEEFEDTTNQEEFGFLPLEVANDWITDNAYASDLAEDIVTKYSPSNREYKIKLPARPQIQIGDRMIIEVAKGDGFEVNFDEAETFPNEFTYETVYYSDEDVVWQEHLVTDSTVKLGSAYYTKIGQSFLLDIYTRYMRNRFIYMRKVGNPEGDVVMKTYAHTGTFGIDGTPTGAELQSGTLVSEIGTDFGAVQFNYAGGILLPESLPYFSTFEYDGGDADNYYEIQIDTSNAGDGNGATYDGSWAVIGDLKHTFYSTYQNPVSDLYLDNGLNMELVSSQNYMYHYVEYQGTIIFENSGIELNLSRWGESNNQWTFSFDLYIDANNGLQIHIYNADLYITSKDAGVTTYVFYEYDTGILTDNRSLRLIQAGDYIYAQSSKDGVNWVTIGEIANPSWVGQPMLPYIYVDAFGNIPDFRQNIVIKSIKYLGFEEKQVKRIQNTFSVGDGLLQTLYLR